MPKTRTMYMHTLDGEPAAFQRGAASGTAWLYKVGGRNKVKLAVSLTQIRQEQSECLDTVEAEHDDPKSYYARCGYVLVEVPLG